MKKKHAGPGPGSAKFLVRRGTGLRQGRFPSGHAWERIMNMRGLGISGVAAGLLCIPPASHPALAASPVSQPAARPPAGNGTAAVLSSIVHPPLEIVDAMVVDANGAAIGTVARVEVTPAGVPVAVAVTPAGKPDQLEVLNADAVSYDAATNRIVARRAAHG
jgi:hypothetical protein